MIVAMRLTRSAATPRLERLALGTIAVALFGLISMHGWGSHSSQPLPALPGEALHVQHGGALTADTVSTTANAWHASGQDMIRISVQTPAHQTMYAGLRTAKAVSVLASQQRDIVSQHPTSTGIDDTGETRAAGRDGHNAHGGLVGLCLAILAGLVLLALLLTGHCGVHPLAAWLPAWSLPVCIGRDRAPPDLLRLCVVRC